MSFKNRNHHSNLLQKDRKDKKDRYFHKFKTSFLQITNNLVSKQSQRLLPPSRNQRKQLRELPYGFFE